eukprot:3928781-Rhodomonas_salina.2
MHQNACPMLSNTEQLEETLQHTKHTHRSTRSVPAQAPSRKAHADSITETAQRRHRGGAEAAYWPTHNEQ